MKNLKDEKGAITLVVLVTMLFLVSFLMSSFMIVSNRAQKEQEISQEIQKTYSNNQNLNAIYDSYFGKNIIPIYNIEQLLAIGTDTMLEIKGKYYKMQYSATYALMNNLEFDVDECNGGNDWIPINNREEFTGYFEGNGYIIKVTDSKDNVKTYSGVNYYSNLPEKGDIVDYIYQSSYTTILPYQITLSGCEGGFTPTNLGSWKVLTVDETRGIIELIPSTISDQQLTISGASGYNNSIKALNNICKEMYSNKENKKYEGIARSITVEDIIEIVGNIQTTGTKSKASNLTKIPTGYLKQQGIANIVEDSVGCGYISTTGISNADNITITDTHYSKILEAQTNLFSNFLNINKNYWLASNSVNLVSLSEANFGIRIMEANGKINSKWVFNTEGNEISGNNSACVMPVVELTLKQPLKKDSTTGIWK